MARASGFEPHRLVDPQDAHTRALIEAAPGRGFAFAKSEPA